MSDIPEWALQEACKRLGEKYASFTAGRLSCFVSNAIRVCAQLIAEHEEPPVDPLEAEAQAVADHYLLNLSAMPTVEKALLSALKRGMELAREASQ